MISLVGVPVVDEPELGGVRVLRVESARALRRHLARRGSLLVVAPDLEALGDGDSSQQLAQTLTAITEQGADLVVAGRAIDSAELRGMLALIQANQKIQRSKIASGKRASRARQGRPRLEVDLDRARRLRAEGASYDDAAKQCGVSKSTIRRRLQSVG